MVLRGGQPKARIVWITMSASACIKREKREELPILILDLYIGKSNNAQNKGAKRTRGKAEQLSRLTLFCKNNFNWDINTADQLDSQRN